MKISTILSILLHTCVSADPFRNKFHVASMDEISEKSSELVYLGQQLVFQNGVPIDISGPHKHARFFHMSHFPIHLSIYSVPAGRPMDTTNQVPPTAIG
mmetsp:Transcript_31341/g.50419  ORF Transcript_31341/g.50419 Transcript_31341/m.50419 type:complete len:99 (-) Transcript_31341:415-711(-)